VNIAIIPARGGSKRIPRKNIKEFCGKPMIGWSIEAARESGLFGHILVSTDDPEIASVSRQFGAEAPFARPAELSDDHATTDAVLAHAVAQAVQIYGRFASACCIYPTNPLLSAIDLRRGHDLLVAESAPTAFPVVRYDFPIQQAFVLEGAHPRARWPDQLEARSQDLAPHFHDAGAFYWFDALSFSLSRKLFVEDAVVFEIERDRCQDINTPEDWQAAEVKFRILEELGRR
jgi:pseudaminic acid cytidylyltransferase